jgi:hypothetical protein
MQVVQEGRSKMSEIEQIRTERKNVLKKMVETSSFIHSREFQYAKGREAKEVNVEAERRATIAKNSLDLISEKVVAKQRELGAEFEKIERMHRIKDTYPQEMWEYYLRERGLIR